jgi:hypothetical protein
LEEVEFFPSNQINDVRQVSERYISKVGSDDYWIIMESTAGNPMGLFDTMFKEENSMYTKTKFDYTVPLAEGMYSQKEIDIALKSVSASRELLCQFAGFQGTTFRTSDIDRAQTFEYDADLIAEGSSRTTGLDPAWGSSKFGIVVSDYRDGRCVILKAEEFEHSTNEDMTEYV